MHKYLLLLLITNNAFAAQPLNMASSLGVTMPQLLTCIKDNRPTTPATDMDKQRQIVKVKILPCLQKANPKLTAEEYDKVMYQFEPPKPPIK